MGQIIIGDGGKPTRVEELVMGLHRSDQQENVRRIEAVVADMVAAGVRGEGEAAGAAVRAAVDAVEAKVAEAETQVGLLRAALEEAGKLAADQQARIGELEAALADAHGRLEAVNTLVDTPPAPEPLP
jgi:hypothetical protein